MRLLFFGDADARVAHGDELRIVLGAHIRIHAAAGRREIDGIDDQVGDDTRDERAVGRDRREHVARPQTTG